jgi:exodeoxyribonuclease VII small subunit
LYPWDNKTPVKHPKISEYLCFSVLKAFCMPKAKPSASDADASPVSYEAALQELETLVAHMESGQLPLEQLLSGYKRGAELLAYCRAQLDAVEQQIKVLDNGLLKPWNGA